MKTRIALATVSGKAYYRLVNELKQRKVNFLSLVPSDSIPPSIEVVISTEKERLKVGHPTVLVYDPDTNPSGIIDEAIRKVQSKEIYEEVVVGIDTGKTLGIAVLADGKTLSKREGLTLEMAIDNVFTELENNPAKTQKVKIGNGIPDLAEEIAERLGTARIKQTVIELVSETGTSSQRGKGFRRKFTDADAAVRIARKNGIAQSRRQGIIA